MVDSSIGGKTGVDLPEAKNFVGAFYQPGLVWADIGTLKTLPQRELSNGMAEAVKYGVIADASLFGLLEKRMPELLDARSPVLPRVVAACAQIKADVVSEDEKETRGLREILNFGHTWGHAIETFTGYREYKHGEAISIGMCAAGRMARELGTWSEKDQGRMEQLLADARLPLKLKTRLPSKRMMEILARDKKNRSGKLRFVIPLRIGKVAVREVSPGTALKGLLYVS